MKPEAAGDVKPNGLFAWYTPGHSDHLGDRLRLFDNTDGPPLELLRLRPDFARVPDFEFSLRARVAELRDFHDERYARVCRTDKLPEPGGGLAVVSERTEGARLSEMLRLAAERGVRVPASLALPLLAELVDAVAALHARGSHIAHGALGPERLVVTPGGRLRVTDYVLGSALCGLRLDRQRSWRELGLALPLDPAVTLFDQRTDVVQIGTIALALVLSRTLGAEDYPSRLDALLNEAEGRSRQGGWEPFWPRFRGWVERTLRLEGAIGFSDALEARDALFEMAGGHAVALPEGGAWEGFDARIRGTDTPILALDNWERNATADDQVGRSPEPAPRAGLESGREPSSPSLLRAIPPPRVLSAPLEVEPEAEEAMTGEKGPGPFSAESKKGAWPLFAILLACLTVLAGGEALYIASRFLPATASTSGPANSGTASVESHPAGAAISVNGKPAGRTPVSLQLPAGRHTFELTAGNRHRTVAVAVKAGTTTSLVVELSAEATAGGQLRVATTPPGGQVIVDGQPRGISPVLIADLSAGDHEVVVENRGRSVRQLVAIEAGSTAALVLPLPGSEALAPGWLTIAAAIEVQVYEDGELLGTSRSPRIMLRAGRHDLELVNEELGLRTSRQIVVPAARTAMLELELPTARIDINATPWAEVWVDGERIGETPLGGVPVRIGHHVVTFRHSTLGERRVECVVSLNRPTRLGVDLRK